MLKYIFGLGCLLAPLYSIYRKTSDRPVYLTGSEPQQARTPFLHFAPKLVIVTNINVPVTTSSNNGKAGSEAEALNSLQADITKMTDAAAELVAPKNKELEHVPDAALPDSALPDKEGNKHVRLTSKEAKPVQLPKKAAAAAVKSESKSDHIKRKKAG